MKKEQEHKPYIPAERITPEFTVTSVISGIILAVVFGAANAYLGLRVGLTVSASIPAAVISMGVIRGLLKRNSILESNTVQTIGSAGESIAAGAIFTIPALFLWAKEGAAPYPDLWEIFLIALCGGLLGVAFMIPLRNALIVKEHGILPYPEGTACAEVLLAGEEGGKGAGSVFSGMGIAAVIKLITDGLHIAAGTLTVPVKALRTHFSVQIYPALPGVGYICGARIASYMFAGGLLGWFVLIPAIAIFGGDTVLYPGTVPISQMYETGGASAIWSSYIRYIGAGAVAAGGIISLVRSLPIIFSAFSSSIKGFGNKAGSSRTDRNLDIRVTAVIAVLVILLLWLYPGIPVSLAGTAFIVIFGFFFATVSSRMTGLVGSSNNPVSGMTIATLLVCTLLLKLSGETGSRGMTAAVAIGSIICIIASVAGDTSQDLKTGFLVGATPKKQQMGELIGCCVSAAAIGAILYLLNAAWSYGSKELPAAQATLMKLVVEGVMGGNLPWALVLTGVFIALAAEVLGAPVLPFAIGLYLPIHLSAPI
ncbi:MAG: OPT family oligopeptide transporter, partial [Huintestinicola sp.]